MIVALCLLVVAGFAFFVGQDFLYRQKQKAREQKIQDVKNEQIKHIDEITTKDSPTNFNNSIDILSKLSQKRKK